MIRHLQILALYFFMACPLVSADSSDWVDSKSGDEHKSVAGSKPQTSFDKRLPPLLPGQEVNAGGNRMKMWSTTGPVPVSKAPEPWKQGGEVGIGSVGVVVDERAKELATPKPSNR